MSTGGGGGRWGQRPAESLRGGRRLLSHRDDVLAKHEEPYGRTMGQMGGEADFAEAAGMYTAWNFQ